MLAKVCFQPSLRFEVLATPWSILSLSSSMHAGNCGCYLPVDTFLSLSSWWSSNLCPKIRSSLASYRLIHGVDSEDSGILWKLFTLAFCTLRFRTARRYILCFFTQLCKSRPYWDLSGSLLPDISLRISRIYRSWRQLSQTAHSQWNSFCHHELLPRKFLLWNRINIF